MDEVIHKMATTKNTKTKQNCTHKNRIRQNKKVKVKNLSIESPDRWGGNTKQISPHGIRGRARWNTVGEIIVNRLDGLNGWAAETCG